MKLCCICKNIFDLTAFYKNCKSKDGYTSYCKECSKAYNANYRTITHKTVSVTEKQCNKCKEVKSADDFTPRKQGKFGLSSHCKQCRMQQERERRSKTEVKQLMKEYRIRTQEKRKMYTKEYTKNNLFYFAAKEARKRAALRNQTPCWLTQEHLNQIKEIYRTCPKGYHVDHIVPLQGKEVSGLHVPWNLQHLPAKENIAKGNTLCLTLI